MDKHRGLVLALTVGMLAVATTSVWGQEGCVAFRAMGQARLFYEAPLNPGDIWGGEVYATLGGQEFLVGRFSGQDGTDVWNGVNDQMGKGKGGSYTFSFGLEDSFTTYVTNAVFPNPPGKVGFGHYQGAHKIVSGRGRFQNASGNIVVAGTYAAFLLPDGITLEGRWNPDISGKICNVAPPAEP